MPDLTWYRRLDFVLSRVCVLVFVGGIVAASFLVPPGVDAVASSVQKAGAVVDSVTQHPLATRAGYFFVVTSLLAIAPATDAFRRAAVARGSRAAEVGWRLIALGAAGGALGNAFAPLILPSVVGLDRNVMAQFVWQHENSPASYGLLVVYAFLGLGAIPFVIGLIRSRTVPLWRALALGLGLFAFLLAPLGVLADVVAIVLAAGLIWPPDVRSLNL